MNENLSTAKRSKSQGNLPLLSSKVALSKRTDKKNNAADVLPQISSSGGSKRKSSSTQRIYKYKLLSGNNTRVVLAQLRKRPWWHASSNYIQPNGATAEEIEIGVQDEQKNPPNFIWEMYRNSKRYKDVFYSNIVLNHIQNNDCLVSKRGVYYTLRHYCETQGEDLLSIIPRTFYLKSSTTENAKSDDFEEFSKFNDFLRSRQSTKMTAVISDGEEHFSSTAIDIPVPVPVEPDNPTVTQEDVDADADVDVDPVENAIWILKPASLTNRGFGIKVVKGLTAVMDIVNPRSVSKKKQKNSKAIMNDMEIENGNEAMSKCASKIAKQSGWIVQEYMDRPLLVHGRKFDIRCFVLVTLFGRAGFHGYFFEDMYIRTSSKKYSLTTLSDRETHLTNDAVQKHSKAYGKFESGNKLTLDEFQESINRDYPGLAPPDIVRGSIVPDIKRLSKISLAAAASEMNETGIQKSFELFGYDYMIDENFKPFLIEINSNPCLEFACPLLTEVISSLIENVMKVALDVACPPPSPRHRTKACTEAVELLESERMKFEHLYP